MNPNHLKNLAKAAAPQVAGFVAQNLAGIATTLIVARVTEALKPREPKPVVLEDAPEDMDEDTIVEETK